MNRDSIEVTPDKDMTTALPARRDRHGRPGEKTEAITGLEQRLLRRMLEWVGNPPVEIRLWTGERIGSAAESVSNSIHIADRQSLWRLLVDPTFQFGETYSAGSVEVDGELLDLLRLLYRAQRRSGRSAGGRGLTRVLHRPRRTTTAAARENIHHHYDIGNDFYRLWLDEQLLYTCAYFPEPTISLEAAQVAKMDHVCRKLWLRPDETVIEAGCGWGALALHMAREYGVRVRAYNISHAQVAYARQRAHAEGLADRVEFIEKDWRQITGQCDAFVSVGMLEHVGIENYRHLGTVIDSCLLPHGRGLIHTIARNRPRPLDPWIERRIFPGANPPSLQQMTEIFEPHRLSVLDLENLRLHYARTLEHWHARFEKSAGKVRAMFDERFVRTWRLYLLGSQAAFETGALQLLQVTFARESLNDVPWTRAGLYQSSLSLPRGSGGADA